MVKANFFKAIAVGVLVYRVFQTIGKQRRLIEQYGFRVNYLKVVGIGLDEVKFNLQLNVENTTAATINLGRIDLDVFLDGIKIGRAINDSQINIGGYSNTNVNFDVRTKFKELGAFKNRFLDVIKDFSNKKVRLVGNITVETLPNVYKEVKIDFEQKVIDFI
jgi:LEA14-like dessication related protein